ncbi:hypothetical protein ACLOJK_028528, partial [Asimina triloba]
VGTPPEHRVPVLHLLHKAADGPNSGEGLIGRSDSSKQTAATSSFRIQPDLTSASYLPSLPAASMTHTFEQPNPPLLMGFSFRDPGSSSIFHHHRQMLKSPSSISTIQANREPILISSVIGT